MELVFSNEYTGILAILLILVVVLYIMSKRAAKKRMIRFGNYEILERVIGKKLLSVGLLPLFLRILALTFLIISISEPKLIQPTYISNTDFVLAIDSSASMLTEDYEPNRLEFAKQMSLEWMTNVREVMVGVVTFAGKPYVRERPTTNLKEVVGIIKEISVDTPGGTAIGEALITSTALLTSTENQNKTIILITDGRNNVGISIADAVETLKRNNIKVIAIGLGTIKNETLNLTTILPPELAGRNATEAAFPDLDEEELSYLANQTGGSYFRAVDAESFKEALEAGLKYREGVINLTVYLLLITCALFLAEWSFEITKYRPLP